MKNFNAEEIKIIKNALIEYEENNYEMHDEKWQKTINSLIAYFKGEVNEEKKRIIKIKDGCGNQNKYVLITEYNGFGIYQEKTPNGFSVHQSWLISNNKDAELVINSYNGLCKEEVLDIIDNYNKRNKFGVKAVKYCDAVCMHPNGKLI